MSDAIIEVQNVFRDFDDGQIRALDNVSLSIYSGESLALTGPSGSGKSTLLNIMGTLDFASQGTVRIKGSEITPNRNWDAFRNGTIGFVFQLFHLIPDLTVIENVEVALMPMRLTRSERQDRAEEIIKEVGLERRMTALPTKLSGGERQRTAIARALVTDPALILADEPTGNLDSQSGEQILNLLMELITTKRKTLVLVTHNTEYALQMGRVLEIVDGKIIQPPV